MSKFNSSPNHISYEILDKSKPTFNQKLLKEKINELQNVIQRAEKEQHLSNQTKDKTNPLQKAKQSLNSFDKVSIQKDSQIENLIIENQKLVKTIQKLETKVNNVLELQKENQNLKQNVEDLKSEIENLTQKKTQKNDTKLSSDVALGFIASKRGQEIQILTNEVKEAKQKNQHLQTKIDKLIQENQNLQFIIKNTDNQCQRTDSQTNSIQKNKVVDKLTDEKHSTQNDQITQLQQELEDAKKTINQLQKLNKINKFSQSFNYKFSNSNDKISKSQSLEPSLFEKDKKLKELEDQIKKIEFEKDSQIQNTKLECVQDMKLYQERLKQEYDQKQSQYQSGDDKSSQDKIKKLNAENNKFQIMLERQNKEIINMEKKLTEFLIQQEELKKNLKNEQQFQSYLKYEKQMVENKLTEKDKEISDYKEDIIKLSKERQQLKDQIEKLKFEVKMSQYKNSNKPESYQSETSKRNR